MTNEFNLLNTMPKLVRDIGMRRVNKEVNRAVSMKFGREYFDGPREQGYGGYVYDGRWKPVAEKAIERYELNANSRVLDVGCAKGFFLHDLMQICPGIEAFGLDVSEYAALTCHPDVVGRIHLGDALCLPFPDDSFDAVFSINTIHNLDRKGCIKALKEINRVSRNPKRCFVQVDAYRSAEEKHIFEDWMLTAKTYCRPEDWQELFAEAGYVGDCYWTILEFSSEYIIDSKNSEGAG